MIVNRPNVPGVLPSNLATGDEILILDQSAQSASLNITIHMKSSGLPGSEILLLLRATCIISLPRKSSSKDYFPMGFIANHSNTQIRAPKTANLEHSSSTRLLPTCDFVLFPHHLPQHQHRNTAQIGGTSSYAISLRALPDQVLPIAHDVSGTPFIS